MRPRGVVFDMDGLLLDTERVYLSGFRAAMAAHGLPPDDEIFRRMIGTNRALGRRILTEGLAGRVSLEDFDTVWDRHIAEALEGGIPIKPGVRPLAEHLRDIGIPYIIATSTRTDRAHAALARAGLADLFPDVIGGDRVTASKPAPDIYLLACETLGLPPRDCAAFEDSPNGVRAAVAAGLRTVQIPDILEPDAELRALGHTISPDLLSGAIALGLLI